MAFCLDGNKMNETIDTDILEQNRKLAAVKYLALALCLALFLMYGLVVG
ncbi:MAG: hypothetical protein Q7J68_03170 [Thermoplasmata archaeon]|nr:hypothetical protein [Thermoplasmata archaeon]